MSTPWTSKSPGVGLASTETVTLVDGNTFFVGHMSGDLLGDSIEGLFMLDTRVLSGWQLGVDDHAIEPVWAVPSGPFSVSLVGRVPAGGNADSDVTVIRRRHVGRGMREDIELRHHGLETRLVVVSLAATSDFASLFEVKSNHVEHRTRSVGRLVGHQLVITPTEPAAVDALLVSFDRPPDRVVDGRAEWVVSLEPRGTFHLCVEVAARVGPDVLTPFHRCGEPIEEAVPVGRLAHWRSTSPSIETDDAAFDQCFTQAIEDLGALRIFDPDHAERVVVAAGAPWFMTLFGRDALITAWMALAVDHYLADGVLASLADRQGQFDRADTEEQPGRILHEVRYDAHSARLLGGHNTYYGTIDATPLFVMLVAELARWSGSPERIAPLLPAVDRAIVWMEHIGDRDGDGFIEYERPTEAGLENQGWKDSWDGIRHTDGRLAQAPIALCEVQGYSYAALRGRADIADLLGDFATATTFRAKADALRERFDRAFWLPEHGWYAVGLDRDKRPIDSLTSNLGHCLWTGIVPPDRAERIGELLVSDRMFTGWGLRTLAADSNGYNPLSYHCGSVWPHDTAIAIAGLARYGIDAAAGHLARGLLDAASAAQGRLPELFGGFDRSDLAAPVPYPASCSPQAWAAASPLLVARAILGFEPDLIHGTVRLRPRLPPGMTRLVIDGLPLGDRRVRVVATADDASVEGLADGTELIVS